MNNLARFLTAQERDYPTALAEIKTGRKRSHWMWYIFPQVAGLGFSETSKFYAIKNAAEAEAYLQHLTLGARLVEICNALLNQESNNATTIFGSTDDMKLRSCMTLFAGVPGANMVFEQLLGKFFGGIRDERTLRLI